MHFGHICAIRFADCHHRLTRSELTANINNLQISAEICKEQTQIKNADTKTLIDHLQFVECNQLQQTPISKYAVLAPHGALGSAAPLRGAGRSRCIVRLLPVPVRLQKPPVATALPADPAPNLRAFAPWPPQAANFVDFRPTFRRSKTHQKSNSSKFLPKPQKSDP